MRTTITLDDDVAALLRRVQKERNATLKEVVNLALRSGLVDMAAAAEPPERFQTRTFDTGTCALPDLDHIGAVLEWLDVEDDKGHPVGPRSSQDTAPIWVVS